METKPKKAKGPIRTGAVVPILIFVLLIGGYFKLFFDHNLKMALEWTGTQINGAQVDVAAVHTSFLGASFEANGIAITDKNKPGRNILTIGKIHFQFLWDALLRAKFVVQDASITDIAALTPRRTPGYVVPPAPPSKGPSQIDKIQDDVLNQAKAQYQDNILGDLATILNGESAQDQLKAVEGQLKSSLRLKELEAELKVKEAEWKDRLKNMPQGKEIEALGKQLKELKFDTKKPVEFANSLKAAEKILKEADKKVRLVTETGKALNQDVDKYGDAFKDLEKLVQQDLKDLQSRLKIPELNAEEFSKSLFMAKFGEKLATIRKYAAVAQQYMPPKKTAAEKKADDIVPQKRSAGHNYRFPVTTGYPLFWLKHAAIESRVSSSAEYSGNLLGKLENVSTDPHIVGKPSVLTVQGDFPKQQISGVDLALTVDCTGETAKENLKFKVAGYPMTEQKLISSKDVALNLDQATGGLVLNADLSDAGIAVQLTNAFTELKYNIDAKNKLVREVLTKVMTGIPVIDIKASATGNWSHLDMHISSNLGDELSRGFKAELQERIENAKKMLKAQIDDKLGAEKAKLDSQFKQIKGQVSGEVEKAQAEVDKAKKTAETEVDQKKNKSGTKKLEEEGKKLLKKFKFGK